MAAAVVVVWCDRRVVVMHRHEINYENNRGEMLIDCRPSCVNGKCDFGHSCVCEPGWTGRACDVAAAGN